VCEATSGDRKYKARGMSGNKWNIIILRRGRMLDDVLLWRWRLKIIDFSSRQLIPAQS
jgi:hypothetical protein